MTAERFTYYLKNPSHLYQISYQELKSLVVQYPYCQNLRYLLVTKSQIEDSNEYQKDLHLAATYSVDRDYLYQMVHHEVTTTDSTDNFIVKEDYLELKDISETKEETTTAAPIILGSVAGVSAGLVADNIEVPSATKTKTDYVPFERRVKRIKRVNLNEPSENKISESPNLDEVDEPIQELVPETIEETHIEYIEEPTSDLFEDVEEIGEDEIADNISDEPEMIAYMEKPKKRRSVIDQLLGRTPQPTEPIEDISSINETVHAALAAEDELESPTVEDNSFLDLTPVKDTPTYGREVLFEITNKTDKEIDALLQKKQPLEEEDPIDNNITMNETPDEPKETPTEPQVASVPSPKTSFKSYLDQFQPPVGAIEDIEDEKEIENVIEETVEEVKNEADLLVNQEIMIKKNKKEKEKKVKAKSEKIKAKKGKKSKKKKKEKSLVKKVAKKSIQESEDIISETLAELLAEQGSRKKAIQMYKRLSLIFPKKSSFFAEKIKKLKK